MQTSTIHPHLGLGKSTGHRPKRMGTTHTIPVREFSHAGIKPSVELHTITTPKLKLNIQAFRTTLPPSPPIIPSPINSLLSETKRTSKSIHTQPCQSLQTNTQTQSYMQLIQNPRIQHINKYISKTSIHPTHPPFAPWCQINKITQNQ